MIFLIKYSIYFCIRLLKKNQSSKRSDHIFLSKIFKYAISIRYDFSTALLIFFGGDREWKEKFDIEDNEEEDTMTYHFQNRFIFRPDLSGNLTGDEIITMPHPRNYHTFAFTLCKFNPNSSVYHPFLCV